MHLRLLSCTGAALLGAATFLRAEPPATNTPPGPVEPVAATNAPPSTPAPPQANAKSAPGAASPNGANGLNLAGQPVTKAPNTPANPGAPATAAKAPAAKPATSVFDNYLKDLGDTLKLSDDEKKSIQSAYLDDGPALQKILNDAALSPLDQADEVADLRAQRIDKIDRLLADSQKEHEFAAIEAQYRVALTELAAQGGLIAAAPAPAPAAK